MNLRFNDIVFAKRNGIYHKARIVGYTEEDAYQIHFDDKPMDEIEWRFGYQLRFICKPNDILKDLVCSN